MSSTCGNGTTCDDEWLRTKARTCSYMTHVGHKLQVVDRVGRALGGALIRHKRRGQIVCAAETTGPGDGRQYPIGRVSDHSSALANS